MKLLLIKRKKNGSKINLKAVTTTERFDWSKTNRRLK